MQSWEEKNGFITRTASLQFKICLHRISDVPASVEDPKTNIDGAITCMDWNSSYEMKLKKKVFEEKATLHSACQQ